MAIHGQTGKNFIIQIDPDHTITQVEHYFLDNEIRVDTRMLAQSINAYLLEPHSTATRESIGWKKLLANCPAIRVFQPNRSYEKRKIMPNDPKYPEQWYLDLIGMPEAWELTTGQVPDGHYQPVIGVLEAGYDINRPEFQGILFENLAEIPGNNIDDDNNGFIDDVNGWNFDSDDGVHYIDYTYHGDAVVSIMAAPGNDQTGTAGVNWHASVLPLTLEARNTDAATIEAYEYFYQMRKTFNETDGEQGAFVVATNSSFGLDGLFETDAPLFCAMFDKMGSVGILSVGATSNNDVNVDINGDLPSDCSSDKLIVVNSIDRNLMNQFSGRGTENVDLAAPAENIIVVDEPGQFIDDSGTSFAAPQVSGVISLAYTLGLDSMQRAVEQNPVLVAESVLNCILENTTSAPDLVDENATGGYLNANATLECIFNKYFVPESDEKIAILKMYPNATSDVLQVEYSVKSTEQIDVLVYDMLGKLVLWDMIDPITEPTADIDVRKLAAGVYALSLIQDGKVVTEQFIKH